MVESDAIGEQIAELFLRPTAGQANTSLRGICLNESAYASGTLRD